MGPRRAEGASDIEARVVSSRYFCQVSDENEDGMGVTKSKTSEMKP